MGGGTVGHVGAKHICGLKLVPDFRFLIHIPNTNPNFNSNTDQNFFPICGFCINIQIRKHFVYTFVRENIILKFDRRFNLCNQIPLSFIINSCECHVKHAFTFRKVLNHSC